MVQEKTLLQDNVAVYLIYAVMPRRRDKAVTAAACHGMQNN